MSDNVSEQPLNRVSPINRDLLFASTRVRCQ